MSLAVFLAEDLTAGQVRLTGAEGRHAAGAKRLRVGEQVELVDGRGTRARCEVLEVARDEVLLAVGEPTVEPTPSPRLVVVQALPKGDRGELAVEMLTEIGVGRVVPWAASRSVAVWRGERAAKSLAKWRGTAREAAKQARRTWFPEVEEMAGTAEVVELVRSADLAVVLHEDASQPLPAVGAAERVVVVVGPEGGLTDEEVAAFVGAGAVGVRLGTEVLRTSTAGVAAVAALLAGTGRWRGPTGS